MQERVLQLAPGTIVAARYRIEDRIGEGGMAVVFRAHHVGTDSPCALKFIHPRLLAETALLEQFLNEARIAAKIGAHPHIVTVFDTGLDGNLGIPFIAMELLSGQPLRRLIAKQAPLPWEIAIGLLTQLADALDEAHAADIVHRDLKPGNVFVVEDRRGRLSVKVLDFGIAKVLDGAGDNTATEVGTPWYNAPEQLGAKMRSLAAAHGITIAPQVSAATDVWALGLIAYELLCGLRVKAYWGAQALSDQMLKVALDPREAPSTRAGDRAHYFPPGFDAWFLCCLNHDASQRFASAGAAIAQLTQLMGLTDRPSDATLTPAAALDTSSTSISGPGEPPSPAYASPAQPVPSLTPPRAPAAVSIAAPERDDTVQTWQATLRGAKQRTKVALIVGAASLLFGVVGGIALLWPGGSENPESIGAASPAASGDDSARDAEGTVATTSAATSSNDDGDAGSGGAATAKPTTAEKPPVRTTRPRPPRPRPRPAPDKPASDPFGRSQR